MHYGVVIDEYGSTKGMITMDDLVDALLGDTSEESQSEYGITQRDENSWFVDGMYSLSEFQKYFELELEEEMLSKYTTMTGIFLYSNNELPELGHKVIIDNYVIEVVDKDGQKLDKVLVTKI